MPRTKPEGNRIQGEIQRKEEWLKQQNYKRQSWRYFENKRTQNRSWRSSSLYLSC